MSANQSTKELMKTGVIIAVAILVLRLILEQLGAPEMVNNIFGIAWLYFILPVFFALRIAAGGEPGPFKALFKNLVFFALYTRLMVLATYEMAYFFRWKAPRFSLKMGGNVGENVSPLMGLLVIPVRNAAIWVIFAVLTGMIIGGITLWAKKKSSPAPSA